jgi:predicted DNA-binding protein (MmcQ/YjbR family)
MPFGPNNLVFKRKLRIFLLVGLEDYPIRFNVKCDPEKAIALREEYPESIFPGYHMNKKHWNTVYVDGRLIDSQLHEFIRHSYELVKK